MKAKGHPVSKKMLIDKQLADLQLPAVAGWILAWATVVEKVNLEFTSL